MSSQVLTLSGDLALDNGKVGRTQFPSTSQGHVLTSTTRDIASSSSRLDYSHHVFSVHTVAVCPEGLKSSCA